MNPPGKPSILLVEDDVRLCGLISQYLGNHDLRVSAELRGDQAVDRIRREAPDVVILDLGLPGQDGFSILRQLRPAFAGPLLILTARDDDFDQVLGLELGADDYVIKPVEPRVLLARINALLRRSRPEPHHEALGSERSSHAALEFGRLRIHPASRSVSLDGRPVALSSTEFDLLVHLAEHAGEIQSRDDLFRRLHGREYDGVDRMLDVRISHLRRKLGEDASESLRIKTVWGRGYLFVADAW